ncbi:hypothetical protein ABH940_006212 [Streptacidiphilus sp. BW17]
MIIRQAGSVIAEITALVGILSTVSALWISVSDHRQRAAEAHEAARGRERAEAERRKAERDAERRRLEAAATEAESRRLREQVDAARERERAEAELLWQLNKLVIRLRSAPPRAGAGAGAGAGSVTGWSVVVRNPSGLPILDVQGFWRGVALAEPVDVQGGSEIDIAGPHTDGAPRLSDLSVHLTDAQHHRWRQDLDGQAWSGTRGDDGASYTWTPASLRWGSSWDAPAAPVPVPAPAPDYGPSGLAAPGPEGPQAGGAPWSQPQGSPQPFPVMPQQPAYGAPAPAAGTWPVPRPRLRPVLLFLWLLSTACFASLLLLK